MSAALLTTSTPVFSPETQPLLSLVLCLLYSAFCFALGDSIHSQQPNYSTPKGTLPALPSLPAPHRTTARLPARPPAQTRARASS